MGSKAELIESIKRHLLRTGPPRPVRLVVPIAILDKFAREIGTSIASQVMRDIDITRARTRKYAEGIQVQDAPGDFGKELADDLKETIDEEIDALTAPILEAADALSMSNAAQVSEQVGTAMGVGAVVAMNDKAKAKIIKDLARFEKRTKKYLAKTRRAAIRKMTDDALKYLRKGARLGNLYNTIEIQREITGVAATRAEMIARNEAGNAFAAMSKTRHLAAGVTKYTWVTAQDGRVRPQHQAQEYQVYSYANPPPGGNPGEPILCRCVSIPEFDFLPVVDFPNPQPGRSKLPPVAPSRFGFSR